MKTNKIPLALIPSDTNKEENKVLDTITKLTNEQNEKELTHYAYSLTATIERVDSRATATVKFTIDKKSYTYKASSIQALQEKDEAKECLLTFNKGKIDAPIITGIIQTKENEPLVISCEEGVVLECGDTRIELDADGTLDLKALHINSQAYGPYRIKGGSVKIN